MAKGPLQTLKTISPEEFAAGTREEVRAIGDRLIEICTSAAREKATPGVIAERMAEDRLTYASRRV